MKGALHGLLQIVGALIALFVVITLVIVMLGMKASTKAHKGAEAIKPGMTVEQFVQNFPKDFDVASIGETERGAPPCIAPAKSVTPEEAMVAKSTANKATSVIAKKKEARRLEFPAVNKADTVATGLANDASRPPYVLDRFLALDRYLSSHDEYQTITEVWAFYLQNNPTESRAYCERAGAYQHLRDYFNAYKDAKQACKLGEFSCCQAVKTFPPEMVERMEKQAVLENAPPATPQKKPKVVKALFPPCPVPLTPVRSFMVTGPLHPDGKISVHFPSPDNQSSEVRMLSPSELMILLNTEYKDRRWSAGFTYLTMTSQRFSFSVLIAPDGKVQERSDARSWD